MASYFENQVDKAMLEVAQDALKCPLGDSHKHAFIKGRADGMRHCLDLYRRATRQDVEGDGA